MAKSLIDKTIRLWNVESRTLTSTLHGSQSSANPLRFSDDGRTLSAFSMSDSVIRRWDVASGSPRPAIDAMGTRVNTNWGFTADLRTMGIARRGDGGVMVAQQASGPSIISAAGGAVLAGWWPPTGRPLVLLRSSDLTSAVIRDAEGGSDLVTIPENTRRLPAGDFSPDGQTVALSAADNAVRLWNTKTAKLLVTLKGHTDEIHAIRFSADGRMVASVSADKTLRLWDVVGGALIATLEGHTGQVYGVAISPDGRTVASGSTDKSIRLWDVQSNTQLGPLMGHTGLVPQLTFSPDGRTLASGSSDGTVRLWNVSDRTLRATRRTRAIYAMSFSPDSRSMVSNGSSHQDAVLWDVESAKAIKIFELGGFYWHFSFSPDGTALMLGTERTGMVTDLRDFKREDAITDWRAQAAKDEARYGLKLEGIALMPK